MYRGSGTYAYRQMAIAVTSGLTANVKLHFLLPKGIIQESAIF